MWWGFRLPGTDTALWPWPVGNQPAPGGHLVVEPEPAPPGPRVGRPRRNRQEIKRRRKQARR